MSWCRLGGIPLHKYNQSEPVGTHGKATEDVFILSVVKGLITTSQEVTLAPFEMQTVASVSKVTGHIKWVHVITVPKEQGFSNEVVTTSMYGNLKPGSSRGKICLQNLLSQKVTVPAWCAIGQIQAASEVPDIYAPVTSKGDVISRAIILKDGNWPSSESTINSGEDLGLSPADAEWKAPTPNQTKLEQIDLLGCKSWALEHHQAAVSLLVEFADVFSRHDLDLGETLLVEHEIKLEPNSWLFHERYCPIPQSMYEEVRTHLQEMLEVGAIRPLSSPWASMVVLALKRDGKL